MNFQFDMLYAEVVDIKKNLLDLYNQFYRPFDKKYFGASWQ